jgi:hypothetical protein
MGGPGAVAAMITRAMHPTPVTDPSVTADWVGQVAERVISVLEQHRATWQPWHVWAETQRQLRGNNLSPTTFQPWRGRLSKQPGRGRFASPPSRTGPSFRWSCGV